MEDQEPKKEPKIVKTTLGELGPHLPIGIPDKTGALNKALDVRRWRMPEEKEIGALRAKHRNKNVGKYVSALLAKMCTQLGPHRFDDSMAMADRMVAINQMLLGDVLYAHVWLRVKSVGPNIPMDPRCPYCQADFHFEADLSSLEVVTLTDLSAATWEYELREPIEVRGRKIHNMTFGPARWSTLESSDTKAASGLNTGEVKSALIYGSICSLDGAEDVPLAPGELDDICKYDIEEITRIMDERTTGPIMAIEGVCPRPPCGRKFKIPIDWMTEDFFSTSFR